MAGTPAASLTPNARDILQYETILSGDIGNDSNVNDNSYSVVFGGGADATAVIDGFTITGGNGGYGGGMYNLSCLDTTAPTVSNCIFRGNRASSGGGMFNIVDDEVGGDMDVNVVNCIFIDNHAEYLGGGIHCRDSSTTVTNCTFSNNSAQYGGAISGPIMVTNSILWDDDADSEISWYGNPTINYSDIEGGWLGVGNINIDPCFVAPDSNDYHLQPNSPCIDAGTNSPPSGLEPKDIDGEPRIMCCGVDMGMDEYYCFPADPNQAQCPSPKDNSKAETDSNNINRTITLNWGSGNHATSHDVYFGTVCKDVKNAADPNILPGKGRYTINIYDVNNLELGQVYYWRIDEVNRTNIWKGNVWNFVFDHLVVEDFESYNYIFELLFNWYSVKNYCILDLLTTTKHPGNKVIGIQYDLNDCDDEINREFATPQDWTEGATGGAKALSLWMRGLGSNQPIKKLYVQLVDSDYYVSNKIEYSDANSIVLSESWVEWNISLAALDNGNFDMSAVKKIAVGLDDTGATASHTGKLYVDDIRLYPSRCTTEPPVGDINGDCVVDYKDLEIIAKEWCDGCGKADLKKDDMIDFRDFAILADNWLAGK